MLLQIHGRFFLAAILCLVTLFFIFSLYDSRLGSSSRLAASDGIANKTLGFEKIFVINAPWRTDRKDAMSLMASFHDISFDWVDGIDPEQIKETAYPPGNHREVNQGARGCWRAHMNALREVITQNLSTALIFEDDIDWDIRLRTQLSSFARAARTLPSLIQQSSSHSPQHPPTSKAKPPNPTDLAQRSSIPLTSTPHSTPSPDPYGRDWDILYLGHCGASLPPPSPFHPTRITHTDDPTVPVPKHLRFRSGASQDAFATLYPPHTRLYHRTANSTLCLHAYAVTQRGARKLLYHFGMRDFSQGFDFAVSDYCGGDLRRRIGEREGEKPVCLTVQPPLVSQYWSESGGGGDITGTGGAGRMVGSRYVRWSARAGLGRRWSGVGDQWPDDE
ncbi:hypothetical protein P280DRAFT_478694 [Massarina eburnea CBS 473.64]|uniref:Glycosyl transferase family 25 domain-containing protein n=1 Tax=Massarina eburnea CBS 473.64 TaxID=1395130 RepID=A0A6A6S4S2_9PLEO|nr:hypothetical protein P280DRAFT_478694 [Massarina eburnea CBS 473.64]